MRDLLAIGTRRAGCSIGLKGASLQFSTARQVTCSRSWTSNTIFPTSAPLKCELDVHALKRARVFVDSLYAAASNGDVGRAIQAGSYALSEAAGELGEVSTGTKSGRLSAADITIAKFVGIGAQDLVAAEVSLARLRMGPQALTKTSRDSALEAVL